MGIRDNALDTLPGNTLLVTVTPITALSLSVPLSLIVLGNTDSIVINILHRSTGNCMVTYVGSIYLSIKS